MTTKKLLKQYIKSSEKLLVEAFSRYYPEDAFCRMDEMEKVVSSSKYEKSTKNLMLELSNRMSRGQIMDNVFHRMEKDGLKFDKKELLDRFEELGISPIPLWTNFCAKRLPSPVTLLKSISEENVEVDYVIIK